ncbi:MAG: hypothetical protein M3237_02095 [Actinomycetota bacterium]|nr:hypothetical protein [Actinomycetota bacterium]
MSVDRSTSLPDTSTPSQVAATARSILACPVDATLVVDGVDDVLAGTDDLAMSDLAGQPTFSCLPDTPLAEAARARRSALLTLESALGPVGSPEREATLTLSGRLEMRGHADCDCCGETRDVVGLELNFALLARSGEDGPGQQVRVPLEHFRSPEHHLNRGFLQRSVEHANACHQEELRRAVSTTTGTRLAEVVGVTLTDLRPDRVEVQWVDLHGSHARVCRFPHRARNAEELGELLRGTLHAGLC